jgi:hypothetical protein
MTPIWCVESVHMALCTTEITQQKLDKRNPIIQIEYITLRKLLA